MKMNFKTEFRIQKPEFRLRTSGFRLPSSERGVALVITLLLLSVTLIMAVAFLAISNRERGSVTTEADTTTARLAADSALANAQAQIIANVLSTTNPYNFGLLVSTNYINAVGFAPGSVNATNVNYQGYANGNPLNAGDLLINLANLFYSPRAPVFVPNPTNPAAPSDFRFYLDLNRNGSDDPNGYLPKIGPNGGFLHPDGTENNSLINVVTNFQTGDPEWIGVLERPDVPHGPDNRFVSRYAFIAVPVGNALDLNAIHNQTLSQSTNSANDGFFRNQGVGSWEMNLAAFLTDLNTNQWDTNIDAYFYQQPTFPNKGRGFEDAQGLLSYRYNGNYNTLATLSAVLGAQGYSAYVNGVVDSYTAGLLMTNTQLPFLNVQLNSVPWAGADNVNHFFDLTADLFDPAKAPPAFTNSLSVAGNSLSSYDRYTFYRLLSQLGTDSTPESGKMNLNYVNVDNNGNIVPNMETNAFAWTPVQFFTNAVDKMLRLYTTNWFNTDHYNFTNTFGADVTPFGVTNIPVYNVTSTNGFVYSPAVNRILQLAANIYDATTNRYYDNSANAIPLPTIFQPIFTKIPDGTGVDVYISGFTEYIGTGANLALTLPRDLNNPNDLAALQPNDLVYGVPVIIGAKKGLPNFNEFEMEGVFQIERKLQFTRTSTNNTSVMGPDEKINQMYRLAINDLLGVECWNSYRANYTRQTTLFAVDKIQMLLTNDEGSYYALPPNTILSAAIVTNNWPGTGSNTIPNVSSFLIPLNTNEIFLPASTYQFSTGQFTTNSTAYESNVLINASSYPQPHWELNTTNNLQVVLIDVTSGRAIDYVQLNGPSNNRDLINEIKDPDGTTGFGGLWATNNNARNIPYGIANQRDVSEGNYGTAGGAYGQWAPGIAAAEIASFRSFYLGGNQSYTDPVTGTEYVTNNLQLAVEAPFEAQRISIYYTSWQANDPLVHYLPSDLNYFGVDNGLSVGTNRWSLAVPIPQLTNNNLGLLNDRYQPWGGNPQQNTNADSFSLSIKDPLMWQSDDWDFPTSKFPTVGWLGRVHRGTPWQTVYLKAANVLANATGFNVWTNWTGNLNGFDAANAAPVQDWLLFDVFSTALNDNATRGQLSINQSINTNDPAAGLAAWSALFSGVMVLSNNASDAYVPHLRFNPFPPVPSVAFPISPAGVNGLNSQLGQLVTNINYARANFTNTDGLVGSFEHVGDILSVPQLTEQLQFLNWNDSVQQQNGISDEMYEWLPQQMMSLLRVSDTPRYVIYSYGQTLKPAQNALVTSGTFFGMSTNYQIVSETATRAVVRVNALVSAGANGILTTNYSTTVEQFNILPPD
jgi:hypothetical protein